MLWISHQRSAPHIDESPIETVIIDGRIFTIGDKHQPNNVYFSPYHPRALPVNVFDPATMKWYNIPNRTESAEYLTPGLQPVQIASNRYSLAAHQRKIYLFGDGISHDFQRVMVLLCYDTVTSKWSQMHVPIKLPFKSILENHGAFFYEQSMYIFGGWHPIPYTRRNVTQPIFNTTLFRLDLNKRILITVPTENMLPVKEFDKNHAVLKGHRFYVFNGKWPVCQIAYLDMKTLLWHEVRFNWNPFDRPLYVASAAMCLYDDQLILFGNHIDSETICNGAHSFDLNTKTWSLLKPEGVWVNRNQDIRTAVVLDNRWYLFGGMRAHTHVLDLKPSLQTLAMYAVYRNRANAPLLSPIIQMQFDRIQMLDVQELAHEDHQIIRNARKDCKVIRNRCARSKFMEPQYPPIFDEPTLLTQLFAVFFYSIAAIMFFFYILAWVYLLMGWL